MSDHADQRDTTNPLTSALLYASMGIYVFPVYVHMKHDGKKDVRPAGLWRTMSTTSETDIHAWWGPDGQHRSAGLAIDCGKSGLVVIDCDGPEGIANWSELEPPPTAVAATISGGVHHYYREAPGHVIGNDQSGKVAPSVDVRGLGGFVIAPPTEGYLWVDEPGWDQLPEVPQVVIQRMKTATGTCPANRESAGPVAATSAPAHAMTSQDADDFIDYATREFTEQQAKAFIKTAYDKLSTTTTGFNGAINEFALICAHFPWLVDRNRCGRLAIQALRPATGWTAPDRDDVRTIDSAYKATEAGRSWTATKVEPPAGNMDTTGGPAPDAATILPPPGAPLAVARELINLMDHTEGELHRLWWQGDFYTWTGAHWQAEPIAQLRRWLYAQTGDAVYLTPDKDGDDTPKPWAPTKKKIDDLVDALGVGVLQHIGEPETGVITATGALDLATRAIKPHAPSRFNLHSLPFAYDPDAACPRWQAFLEEVLPEDRQAHHFLAEWFGYVLAGRTDQQKMANLIGKPRSGKSTITRILAAMTGPAAVTATDLGSLASDFGRADLIGKSLALMGDVRWNARNAGDAVPFLLRIIGEDPLTVRRKYRDDWTGRLGARFMMTGNDVPTFSDRSGAMADRMIHVVFPVSFSGREDHALEGKLLAEMPGILNWALDGLDRLTAAGRFTVPESGTEMDCEVREASNPIGAFVDQCCTIDPLAEVDLDQLFMKWQTWCEGEGRTRDHTTRAILSREIRTQFGLPEPRRAKRNGRKIRVMVGISSDAL